MNRQEIIYLGLSTTQLEKFNEKTIEVSFSAFFRIISLTPERSVVEGKETTATFSCAVEANPFTETTVRWLMPDHPGPADFWSRRAQIDVDVVSGVSNLTLHFPGRSDGGRVICVASNGVGDVEASKTSRLSVFRKRVYIFGT